MVDLPFSSAFLLGDRNNEEPCESAKLPALGDTSELVQSDSRLVKRLFKEVPLCQDPLMQGLATSTEVLKQTTFSASVGTEAQSQSSRPRGEEVIPDSHLLVESLLPRQGRSRQRWELDTSEAVEIQLKTGCIPVFSDSKILMISSKKKMEWVFPKGGWETDESLACGAMRETFEEAGVVGTLGPVLEPSFHEKKVGKKMNMDVDSDKQLGNKRARVVTPGRLDAERNALETESGDRVKVHARTYNRAKVVLFPLYVHRVEANWPENGRLRRLVTIDEALFLTKDRPEFHEPLQEMKRRNLHVMGE